MHGYALLLITSFSRGCSYFYVGSYRDTTAQEADPTIKRCGSIVAENDNAVIYAAADFVTP
jgi:hypothetical protein